MDELCALPQEFEGETPPGRTEWWKQVSTITAGEGEQEAAVGTVWKLQDNAEKARCKFWGARCRCDPATLAPVPRSDAAARPKKGKGTSEPKGVDRKAA